MGTLALPVGSRLSWRFPFAGLNAARASLTCRPMKLLMAFVVWFAMAAVLVKGLLLAIDGHAWLLVVGLLGFVALVAKIGCLSHD